MTTTAMQRASAVVAERKYFDDLFSAAAIKVGGGQKFSTIAHCLLGSPVDVHGTVSLIDAQNLIRAALREIEAA